MRFVKAHPGMAAGLAILGLMALMAVAAPVFAPYSPYAQDLLYALEPPSAGHPMGRDLLGRDVLSRVVYGTRISFTVGFIVIGMNALIGVAAGCAAGAYGGRADFFLMRVTEMAQAFPGLLLAIAIMAALGPGFGNLLLALCLTGWTGFARLARAQVLSLREREFVAAALACGAGKGRLIFMHYLPNAAAPLLVEAAFGLAAVIVAEAGLSFLGLGVQPPEASWGAMINEGRGFLLFAPHLAVFPGLCLFLLVLAVTLVGEELRDIVKR
ncbi:MAG: ABC transporter permease [Nitrospinae bacterium]|nr:ABC transporter permease [Nitrospinota bacterium]